MAKDVIFDDRPPITALVKPPPLSSLPYQRAPAIRDFGGPRAVIGQKVQVYSREQQKYVKGRVEDFRKAYNQWTYHIIIDKTNESLWTNILI
jgi:hypothetical protein